MRLYYHPFSSNARRAVMTAFELNTPVELVLVDLVKREQRQPAFLARNPAGRVPVLEDGNLVLPNRTQSCSISRKDRQGRRSIRQTWRLKRKCIDGCSGALRTFSPRSPC